MRKVFYSKFRGIEDGELDTKFAWPKKGQKLLKKPSVKTPLEVSAHLEWLKCFNSGFTLSESYRESGDFLVEALLAGGDGTHPDRFIFPILYLYRHSIELNLKEIINLGIKLNLEDFDSVEKALSGHSLYALWNFARKIMEKAWPDSDTAPLRAVESIIQDFHTVDKDGQRLRYSKPKDGSQYEHNMPPIVDLLSIRNVMDGVFNLLDGSISGLMEYLSHMEINEMECMQNVDYSDGIQSDYW